MDIYTQTHPPPFLVSVANRGLDWAKAQAGRKRRIAPPAYPLNHAVQISSSNPLPLSQLPHASPGRACPRGGTGSATVAAAMDDGSASGKTPGVLAAGSITEVCQGSALSTCPLSTSTSRSAVASWALASCPPSRSSMPRSAGRLLRCFLVGAPSTTAFLGN